jgi:hypothetical protein
MALGGVIRIIFNFFCGGFANMKNLRRFAFQFRATPVNLKEIAR